MIKLRNKQLAASAAIAALGIGAVAAPVAAVAASRPAHTTIVRADPARPDKPGTKDTTKRDTGSEKAGSVEKASLDRSPDG